MIGETFAYKIDAVPISQEKGTIDLLILDGVLSGWSCMGDCGDGYVRWVQFLDRDYDRNYVD